jgi:hypothetical protein
MSANPDALPEDAEVCGEAAPDVFLPYCESVLEHVREVAQGIAERVRKVAGDTMPETPALQADTAQDFRPLPPGGG